MRCHFPFDALPASLQAAFAKSRGRARNAALRQLAQIGLQVVAAGADLRTFATTLFTAAGDSPTVAIQLPEGAELTQAVQKLHARIETGPGMIFLQLVTLGWERSCPKETLAVVTAAVPGSIPAAVATATSVAAVASSQPSVQADSPSASEQTSAPADSQLQEDHGVGGQLLKEFGF